MSRLPPLNALRAFEAAARHGGFIAAADELNVTRGAVSRHVKTLEDHLGVALFHRNARGVKLNEAGARLLPVLTDAFQRIAEGARQASDTGDTLRIICPPATSVRWLLPRLPEFRALHPDIRISVTTDFFGDRGFDAVEYQIGFSVQFPIRPRSPQIRVEPLLPYILTPACSPAYLDEHGPFDTPADLARCALLRESGHNQDWTDWCDQFAPMLDDSGADRFPNFDLIAKAATMGAGVFMADLALCHEEISLGTLVLPFPTLTCPSPRGSFSLLAHEDAWNTRQVKAFREWAAERAAQDRLSIFGDTPSA
ncbi:LysR family transcriptional regulator [Alphaproteobacteria bacterium GH1-50]|uniref:LysR family transcriptional regulator n=1 Tax=Kangsaoukella pontilimi TaxID=2691042 RepID=A0A7C9IG82_9RHOB|nr:LysR substrate-binding domain-containing protein [Kangsaoukella pontilimi]MXQ08148.1 LysR family transcriptional regulator [Kangsaoukella pontilimi]